MGRIVSTVRITNLFDREAIITCDALVDTGAAYMVLPKTWKERIGKITIVREIDCETTTQEIVKGEACGPVEIIEVCISNGNIHRAHGRSEA